MSAPPRFIVTEVEGRDEPGTGGRGETLSCSVLDRLYCYREVARIQYSFGPLSRNARARREAAAVARPAQCRARRLGRRVILPLWWPRTACIYCGVRIDIGRSGRNRHENDGRAQRHRIHDPRWLACDRHAPLVPCDPLVTP